MLTHVVDVVRRITLRQALAVALVLGGCIWNSFELEHIVTHPHGKQFGYGLTLCQFVAISAISLVHAVAVKCSAALERKRRDGTSDFLAPFQLPSPTQWVLLDLRYAGFSAFVFWLLNVANNSVSGFGIAVPIQQVVRSSSLLSSAASSYWFHGRRFSRAQLLAMIGITVGVTVLSLASVPSTRAPAECSASGDAAHCRTRSSSAEPSSLLPNLGYAEAVMWWSIGLGVLVASALLSTGLGIAQDAMFREAVARLGGAAATEAAGGLTEEALFLSHGPSLILFAFSRGIRGPLAEFAAMPAELRARIVWNVLTQSIIIPRGGIRTRHRVAGTLTLVHGTAFPFCAVVVSDGGSRCVLHSLFGVLTVMLRLVLCAAR